MLYFVYEYNNMNHLNNVLWHILSEKTHGKIGREKMYITIFSKLSEKEKGIMVIFRTIHLIILLGSIGLNSEL